MSSRLLSTLLTAAASIAAGVGLFASVVALSEQSDTNTRVLHLERPNAKRLHRGIDDAIAHLTPAQARKLLRALLREATPAERRKLRNLLERVPNARRRPERRATDTNPGAGERMPTSAPPAPSPDGSPSSPRPPSSSSTPSSSPAPGPTSPPPSSGGPPPREPPHIRVLIPPLPPVDVPLPCRVQCP